MPEKTTQGNAICSAAVADFPEKRDKAKQFLVEQMWVGAEKRFKTGMMNPESSLTPNALAVLALGKEYQDALVYSEQKFLKSVKMDGTGKTVNGFSDLQDKNRVSLEGTAAMAAAYSAVGNDVKAAEYLKALENAMASSKKFAGTAGLAAVTNDPSWTGASEKIYVPSQAWYLFAKWKFNPLE